MTGPQVIRADTASALGEALGGVSGRPVLVVVGGAGGMSEQVLPALSELLTGHVVPLLDRWGVAVVDGGTDAGVMRLMGEVRARTGADFPLIGVAAAGTVALSAPAADGQALPEPRHTHLVLVPGEEWGDESPWISTAAQLICAGEPSATLLINGGAIAMNDALQSLAADRPLLVLAGSGRSADAIAAAGTDPHATAPARTIAAAPLTRVIAVDDAAAVADALAELLTPR